MKAAPHKGLGISDILAPRRKEILAVAEKHGATNLRVFGSIARGEARPDSDLDLIVDQGSRRAPWFPIGFAQDLEELLGRKVDVVVGAGHLHGTIRDRVLAEAVSL